MSFAEVSMHCLAHAYLSGFVPQLQELTNMHVCRMLMHQHQAATEGM